jgi:hypothetical protein
MTASPLPASKLVASKLVASKLVASKLVASKLRVFVLPRPQPWSSLFARRADLLAIDGHDLTVRALV